ncbi:hypothetical protein K439DRAFT_1631926 [Ramaria rubella]|nr:hypothetical protein K439DRAFT_1631926 [Ramaria rubella]
MNCENMLRVLNTLPSLTDWERIAPRLSGIVIDGPRGPDMFLPPEITLFPEMTTLQMVSEMMASSPVFAHPPPQLLDISFFGVSPPASSPIWANRRTLAIQRCFHARRSLVDHLTLIERSPELTFLTISGGVTRLGVSSFLPITATHLVSLTIGGYSSYEVKTFLDCLIIPNITVMDIRTSGIAALLAEPSVNLIPVSQRDLSIFSYIDTLTIRFTGMPNNLGMQMDGYTGWATWTGSSFNPHKKIAVAVPCFGRQNPTVFRDLLFLFPHLQCLTLEAPWTQLVWDLGVSTTVQTLRIIGSGTTGEGDATYLNILEDIEKRKSLPYVNRIELINFPFVEDRRGRIWGLIGSLLGNSENSTLCMTGCDSGYISKSRFSRLSNKLRTRSHVNWVQMERRVSAVVGTDVVYIPEAEV